MSHSLGQHGHGHQVGGMEANLKEVGGSGR